MDTDNFLMELQAKLDEAQSKTNINADISKIQRQINKLKIQAEIDPKIISDLTKQLESVLGQKINISNIGLDQSKITNQAKQAGQQIGQQIQSGINNAVQKGSFKKVFNPSIGNLNNAAKEAESYFKSLSNVVSVEEKLGKQNNLTGFIVNLKNAEGVVEQLKYKYKELTDKTGNVTSRWFEYSGGSINDNGVIKQMNAIASKADSLQIKLDKLKSKYSDINAPKAIKDSGHIAALSEQYGQVLQSIEKVRAADSSAFSSMTSNAEKEIAVLESLITKFRNAEYAATSLRTKDIATVKIDEGNHLNTFIEKMRQSGHYTDELKEKTSTLQSQLKGVFDKESLISYLNTLSNLKSEFESVDAAAKTTEKAVKLQTNIESDKRQLKVYTSQLKEAGVLTGDVKAKIQEMFHSLSKVGTQSGLTTWRSELKGVRAETDAVLKSVSKANVGLSEQAEAIRRSMGVNGNTVAEIQVLANNFSKLGLSADEVKSKMSGLDAEVGALKSLMSGGASDAEIVTQFERLKTILQETQNNLKTTRSEYSLLATEQQRISKANYLEAWLQKNTAVTKEAKAEINEYIASLRDLNTSMSTKQYNGIVSGAKQIENSMRSMNRLGAAVKNQWQQAVSSFSIWLSASTAVMKVISETREAINELKEVDTLLTEISKTNHSLTKSDLTGIGSNAFGTASKYGKTATDYLTGVQDMSRAGYQNAEAMAELSVAAQGAGDMTAEVANKMVIATDKAYKMNGSVSDLRKTLDGVNWINTIVQLYRNIWLHIWLLSEKKWRHSIPRIRFILYSI